MEPLHDYFSMPAGKHLQRASWGNDWSNTLSPWESTPGEMPIWQYTTAALQQGGNSLPYYPTESPVSPSYTNPSSVPSAINSPNVAVFPRDARFVSHPLTPLYDNSSKNPVEEVEERTQSPQHAAKDEEMEDEDSDSYSWELKTGPASVKPSRPPHRRSQSANELSVRNAKRAHTVVEKNYRERLNDKINDLALYLFETSSDSRTKPSKSLVMTRAKERLKQLESRNKSLESEVIKLRQHIAILDHIVATGKGEAGSSTSTHVNPVAN